MEGCGEGSSLGVCRSLPVPEPLFLLDLASSFLRPWGAGWGSTPKPHQQTCEALLGKSLFWYRWRQVLLVWLWVRLSPCLAGVGGGPRASSDPTHSETLKDEWMDGGRLCQCGGGALQVQKWGKMGGWVWNLNTLRKDSKGWGLKRENPGQNKEQPLYNLLQEKKIQNYIYICIV